MVLVTVAFVAAAVAAASCAALVEGPARQFGWLFFASVGGMLWSGAWPLSPARSRAISAVTLLSLAGAVVMLANTADLGVAASVVMVGVLLLVPLWPRPAALRASVLLIACALLVATSSRSLDGFGPVPVLVGLPLVVVLVAATHLAGRSFPQLVSSPFPPPARPARRGSRVATEVLVVFVAAVLAGTAATAFLPPPSSQSEAPGPVDGPALRFGTSLEPFAASPLLAGGSKDAVVFRVRSEHPVLLRAQTFDRWNGRRWRPSSNGTGFDMVAGPLVSLPVAAGDAVAGGEPVVQHITAEQPVSLLIAAPVATRVQLPPGRSLITTPGGSFIVGPSLRPGETYEVTSMRPTVGPAGLPAHDVFVEGIPDELEASLDTIAVSPLVAELAEVITLEAETAYDAVLAIERWLAENLTVVDRPQASPAGVDPLEHLLLVDRRVSQETVTSAFTLMVRTLGIPARMAVGFRPGSPSPRGDSFVVRQSDAYAWAEVWFPGVGWYDFDPVAPRAAVVENPSVLDRLGHVLRQVWKPALAIMVAAVVLAIAIRWWLRRRRWAALPWASRSYLRLVRAGSAAGRPRRQDETAAEYGAALAKEGVADNRLERVGAILTEAAYSADAPSPADRAWVDQVLHDIRRSPHSARS